MEITVKSNYTTLSNHELTTEVKEWLNDDGVFFKPSTGQHTVTRVHGGKLGFSNGADQTPKKNQAKITIS